MAAFLHQDLGLRTTENGESRKEKDLGQLRPKAALCEATGYGPSAGGGTEGTKGKELKNHKEQDLPEKYAIVCVCATLSVL
ncbi:GD15885 [Drosophila simulans]|uniref:GD15885 n=1 Tax=Drosophila simulans TaxID=7240 RepID=B4R4D0_DROSI|nr:GD15885 [Drosophila simulans]